MNRLTYKILLVSIFLAALFGTFIFRFNKKMGNSNVLLGEAIMYAKVDVKYINIDENGFIVEITENKNDNLTELKCRDFKNIFVGKKIDISNDELLSIVSMITKEFNKTKIRLDYIEIYGDNNIRLGKDKVIVDFGDIKNIMIKIDRAVEIYPEIKDLSGTLDLTECRNNMTDEKYIFKKA